MGRAFPPLLLLNCAAYVLSDIPPTPLFPGPEFSPMEHCAWDSRLLIKKAPMFCILPVLAVNVTIKIPLLMQSMLALHLIPRKARTMARSSSRQPVSLVYVTPCCAQAAMRVNRVQTLCLSPEPRFFRANI
ncbi:hypothetical protein CPB86DRAFT_135759 [Serendipita vermifera]|nr:hypothetical protein CPB86DRAFT_135759 [Serendipita vermifera]